MSNDPNISLEVDPTRELTCALFDALSLSNMERTNDGQIAHVCVVARDSAGELVGGTYGEIYWGWLHVLALWVDPTRRRRGLGGSYSRALKPKLFPRAAVRFGLIRSPFKASTSTSARGTKYSAHLSNTPMGIHVTFFASICKARPANAPLSVLHERPLPRGITGC